MGAYISALSCFGGDLEEVIAHTRKEVMRRRPAHDHTLPIISILRGRKLTAIATTVCGMWGIEDLPIRNFCLSADLGEAGSSVVEHLNGPLWEALGASWVCLVSRRPSCPRVACWRMEES
jgi:hypothetical protein